jgi:hypothetical protein
MLEIFIQVILGIFLIIIMAIIAYSIYDNEYVKNLKLFSTNRHETLILDGIYTFDKPRMYAETNNRFDPNYFDLNPSVNQNGGAEYTYNFWLYYNIRSVIDEKIAINDDKNKYIILFLKGDLTLLPYNQNNYACDTDGDKKYVVVKNPLVKLKNDGTELIVEYNNINNPDTYNSSAVKIGSCITNKQQSTNNKLGIKEINNKSYNKTWNMITIVMQENAKNEDELFVNRTNCKVYFNGTLIADRSTLNNSLNNENSADIKSTVMKKNLGNLHLNPTSDLINKGLSSQDYINNNISQIIETDEITKDIPLKMANLSYFNYALSGDDIIKLYNRKFSKKEAKITITISDNNKIVYGDKINTTLYNEDSTNVMPVKQI